MQFQLPVGFWLFCTTQHGHASLILLVDSDTALKQEWNVVWYASLLKIYKAGAVVTCIWVSGRRTSSLRVDGHVTLHSWQATVSGLPLAAAAAKEVCIADKPSFNIVFYFHRKENNLEINVWAKCRDFMLNLAVYILTTELSKFRLILFTVVSCILMPVSFRTVHHTHVKTDLIKCAATPPNQSRRCFLNDYFNNYNFSKAQIICCLMMVIKPKHVGAVLM
jgi:hypothetical protein